MLLAVMVMVASLTIGAWRATRTEMRYPIETSETVVPHETTTVPNPTLARGQTRVVIEGQDGLLRHFTYYEEKWVGGALRTRRAIAAGGRPTSQWITTPTVEVVETGAAAGRQYQLAADDPAGMVVGTVSRRGTFSFRISGSITFAGPVTTTGPHGNSRYDNYQKPLMPKVYPGAALIRVGSGPWRPLSELSESSGVYTVRGKAGRNVSMLVNDATGYYADNRGAFVVTVLSGR